MSENLPNPMTAANRAADRDRDATKASAAADAQLLDRVRAGDQQAMSEIFDRYGRMVYSVALRVLEDAGHAEDVMQEVLFKVWREPQMFLAGRGSLAAWLAVMARNRAVDVLRRRKPMDTMEDVVLASKTNIVLEIEHNSMIEKVRVVLKGLPLEQQTSMELAYFEGLSHSEIAARTGDPLGTVKTRIRTALMSVREALEA
jgi:RNA polymerase sigma-70 factor (ECF subfamily)